MPEPFANVAALVGNTPLVELRSLSPEPGVRLFAKLEGQNPTGSIKDRIVLRILRAAKASGALAPGQRIIEASTGNTGVSLAMFGRMLGHPVDVCVPESVYPEIEELLSVHGARIRRVPRQAGIKTAIEVAQAVADQEGAFLLNQFFSDENVAAHYEGTGAEILADVGSVERNAPLLFALLGGQFVGGQEPCRRGPRRRGVGAHLIEAVPHPAGHRRRLGVDTEGRDSHIGSLGEFHPPGGRGGRIGRVDTGPVDGISRVGWFFAFCQSNARSEGSILC